MEEGWRTMELNSPSIKELEEMLESCSFEEFLKIKTLTDKDSRKKVQILLERAERRFKNLEKLISEYNIRRKYELELINKNYKYIAGVDEVGRGPLAGPVYAAAVILEPNINLYGIKDSKRLSEVKRNTLSEAIKEECIAYSIGIATREEIDEYNILKATKLAMKRAVEGLDITPDYILVDAVTIDEVLLPQMPIIKGDDLSVSIGAASIIAKVERDRYMDNMAEKYPQYLFDRNKGYGTRDHIDAIKKYGICELHRRTFVKNFLD